MGNKSAGRKLQAQKIAELRQRCRLGRRSVLRVISWSVLLASNPIDRDLALQKLWDDEDNLAYQENTMHMHVVCQQPGSKMCWASW